MLALISFIVVMIGAINWFCIGLLQYDFVAGLFGSQSSMFSRIVYIAVGLGALVLLYNLIENKGKIKFNFKKKAPNKAEYERQGVDMYYTTPRTNVEAGKDTAIDNSNAELNNDAIHYQSQQHYNNAEASKDISADNNSVEAGSDYHAEESNSATYNNEAGVDNIGRDVTEETKRSSVEASSDAYDSQNKID